jgi:hypothetical protein
MNNYQFDFSELGAASCQRLYCLLTHISSFDTIQYTVGDMAGAMSNLRYADMLELCPQSRHEFHALFDAAAILSESDKADSKLRNTLVSYLSQNDRNGVYTDDDRLMEDISPLSLPEAVEALSEALGMPDNG